MKKPNSKCGCEKCVLIGDLIDKVEDAVSDWEKSNKDNPAMKKMKRWEYMAELATTMNCVATIWHMSMIAQQPDSDDDLILRSAGAFANKIVSTTLERVINYVAEAKEKNDD